MQNMKRVLPLILAGLALSACQIPSSGPVRSLAIPAPAPVDPAVGDPCTEAAMAKYFIGPERVTLLGASPQGGSTAVRMKADVRDALCLISAKGTVISLTDTTPKSANQIAAEEAAAAAKEAGTVVGAKAGEEEKESREEAGGTGKTRCGGGEEKLIL